MLYGLLCRGHANIAELLFGLPDIAGYALQRCVLDSVVSLFHLVVQRETSTFLLVALFGAFYNSFHSLLCLTARAAQPLHHQSKRRVSQLRSL